MEGGIEGGGGPLEAAMEAAVAAPAAGAASEPSAGDAEAAPPSGFTWGASF